MFYYQQIYLVPFSLLFFFFVFDFVFTPVYHVHVTTRPLVSQGQPSSFISIIKIKFCSICVMSSRVPWGLVWFPKSKINYGLSAYMASLCIGYCGLFRAIGS
ncbi:unnamed protein product [Menidia menidia]|uniref:(Atlantic silverside) hypothetical protein n=1 Tax=Menidia menidia TaxID=238744 RepID=A0A8S4AFZ6_9TELE|nr:unnamed protein product [Menidia menidia]